MCCMLYKFNNYSRPYIYKFFQSGSWLYVIKKNCVAVCCIDNIAVAILYMPVEYKLYFKIQPFFINKYYISNIT